MAETVSGLNIKLSLDGHDLENELKDINKELKGQQKDLYAINQKLKYDSSNVTLWREKQAKLNDVLLATKQKLETQNHELIKAKEAVKIGKMSEDVFSKLPAVSTIPKQKYQSSITSSIIPKRKYPI